MINFVCNSFINKITLTDFIEYNVYLNINNIFLKPTSKTKDSIVFDLSLTDEDNSILETDFLVKIENEFCINFNKIKSFGLVFDLKTVFKTENNIKIYGYFDTKNSKELKQIIIDDVNRNNEISRFYNGYENDINNLNCFIEYSYFFYPHNSNVINLKKSLTKHIEMSFNNDTGKVIVLLNGIKYLEFVSSVKSIYLHFKNFNKYIDFKINNDNIKNNIMSFEETVFEIVTIDCELFSIDQYFYNFYDYATLSLS
jgi:hypothetical protein